MGSETALKAAIGAELTKAGFTRKPGTNVFTAPDDLAGKGVTMTVETDPAPTKKEKTVAEGAVAADQLRLFIERIERLEEEKKGIADDIRDVYSEAKSNGYDGKAMRLIIRARKMETHTRQETVAIVETYAQALGLGQLVLL